jgi:hypothetical protein
MNLLSILEGNTSLLERHERDIHEILSRFYNDQSSNDICGPAWCNLHTRRHNSLRQETSGHRGRLTENGNIVVSDTEGATQNNERYRLQQETSGHRGRLTENGNIVVSDTEGATQNNERCRDVEARSLDQDLSHPSARRLRDPQTSKPQADQKEPPLLVLDDRALRSVQLSSQEVVLPEPSTSLGNPPREGKTMEV